MGIKLLPPDVNASDLDFSIERWTRRPRRRPASSGGAASASAWRRSRTWARARHRPSSAARQDGPFADLDDLCRRVDLRAVGKRTLESLVKAGALDSFGPRRPSWRVLDRMMAYSAQHHQAEAVGQMSLFGDALPPAEQEVFDPLPEVEGDRRLELSWEKELIGLYFSEHPLQHVAEAMAQATTALVGDVTAEMHGQPVTLAGMVVAVRRTTTKKGDLMAFARLEDLQGAIEVILFPRVYAVTKDLWQEDNLVIVQGQVEVRADRVQLVAAEAVAYTAETVAERVAREEAEPYEVSESNATYQVYVTLPRSADSDEDIQTLGRVFQALTGFRGRDRFRVIVANGAGLVELEFPNNTTRYCVSLVRALEGLLGEGCIEVTVA